MPGVFGGFSADPEARRRLASEFETAWSGSDWVADGSWFLGGHFPGAEPGVLRSLADPARWVAVDGDVAAPASLRRLMKRDADQSKLPEALGSEAVGTCALADLNQPCLRVVTDWSGAFPVYWAAGDDFTLFSSLLRPLARTLGASVDPVGTSQYLRDGFTFEGRTVFEGIRRLQPGQWLEVTAGGDWRLGESSRAWVHRDEGIPGPEEGIEEFAASMLRKLSGDRRAAGPLAVMMSAGWDSRTLLGGTLRTNPTGLPILFSHGDLRGREIGIVRDLGRLVGATALTVPIGPDVFDPDLLDRHFRQVESAVFPHWIRSGERLADEGVLAATAGVFGEVLGGHYGPSMTASGYLGKAKTLLSSLGPSVGQDARAEADPDEVAEAVSGSLEVPGLDRPWYLSHSGLETLTGSDVLGEINAGVEADLHRLTRRGVRGRVTLLEAFITEHRGSQYIQAQALSLRSSVAISIPFADQGCFSLASWIPLAAKIHNRLNRRLLEDWWPSGLTRPLAATLVPADAPLLFQEVSRAVRRAYEGLRWSAHFRSAGRLARPRLGWTDFDVFRDPTVHGPVLESLRSDLFDRAAIARILSNLSDPRRVVHAQPYVDQIGKILTVDRLTR